MTQQDVDLARRITEIAADHEVEADPASVSVLELGLDTAHSATIAPLWAALLTGNAIAAAVAAGGTIVDDSDAPSLAMIADQDGNTGVVCVAAPPATKDCTADARVPRPDATADAADRAWLQT